MDFHLDGLIAGQILHVVFKDAGHAHFLSGIHVLVIQHQGRLFQGSVGLGISFRLGIGGLGINVGIFTIVNSGDLDAACVAGIHRFLHLSRYPIHLHHLGILG